MSNIVKEIRDELRDQILVILSSFKVAPYQWDTTENNNATHKNLLAIRPLGASQVSGTNKTVTLDHNFEIELTNKFNKQGKESDSNKDEVIMELFEKHQMLYRAINRRNLNIPRVLVVTFLDMGEPVIDNGNGTVSIIATYTIKYRTE